AADGFGHQVVRLFHGLARLVDESGLDPDPPGPHVVELAAVEQRLGPGVRLQERRIGRSGPAVAFPETRAVLVLTQETVVVLAIRRRHVRRRQPILTISVVHPRASATRSPTSSSNSA